MAGDLGMSESEVRRYLMEELAAVESETSFYWENEETADLLEMVVGLFAKVIARNNQEIGRQLSGA